MNIIFNSKYKIVIYGLLFVFLTSSFILSNFGLKKPLLIEAVEESKPLMLEWLSYNEAVTKAENENKYMMFFFYADGCGWCDKMEKEVYADENVKQILAEKYVSVKINASSNNKIQINSEEMTEKAFALKYQVTGYPTTWFFESKNIGIAPLPGYVSAEQFISVLKYIGEDWYKEITFQEYIEKDKG